MILQFLTRYRQQLRPLQPNAPLTRELAALCRDRRSLVEQRVALAQELKSLLKDYFPAILALKPAKIYADFVLRLLLKYPTLAAVQAAGRSKLRKFFFATGTTQYIILSNTQSLYSCLMNGKGITNEEKFVELAISTIGAFMEDDGQTFVFQRFIAPSIATVSYAKALNRSVTGSMNDLVFHAEAWLVEGELTPPQVGFKLNDIPFSSLKYKKPTEAFRRLAEVNDVG